jgi:hypothetical protein
MLPDDWLFVQMMNVEGLYFCGTACARKFLKRRPNVAGQESEGSHEGHSH